MTDITTLQSRPGNPGRFRPAAVLRRLRGELLEREKRLARFGTIVLLLLAAMALAWCFDDRQLRGMNVWDKPMKFALSIAVLAFTTAWFVGDLPAERRRSRAVDRIVWILMVASSLELAYIAFQAAQGQASHYNVGDRLHAALYALMGLGALTIAATQPLLAWQLFRHADKRLPAVYRQAVLGGLVLTFVLGAAAGAVMAQRQPPSTGMLLPVLGWSLGGGDLRPAHFLGIHAEQILPVIGIALAGLRTRRASVWMGLATGTYCLAFAALLTWGLRSA